MASDYAREFANRREIRISPAQMGPGPIAAARSRFAGLKLGPAPAPHLAPSHAPLEKAVERYARATADILRMRQLGLDELPHQQDAFTEAARSLDHLRPHGAHDLRNAFSAERPLIDEAAKGRTSAAIRAMQMETELRSNLSQRADRFVRTWQHQMRQYRSLTRAGEESAADRLRQTMADMGKSLERDPQLESLLRTRHKELGLPAGAGGSLSHDIQQWLGRSRSRGLGM
jgi:hypothetical protein